MCVLQASFFTLLLSLKASSAIYVSRKKNSAPENTSDIMYINTIQKSSERPNTL